MVGGVRWRCDYVWQIGGDDEAAAVVVLADKAEQQVGAGKAHVAVTAADIRKLERLLKNRLLKVGVRIQATDAYAAQRPPTPSARVSSK